MYLGPPLPPDSSDSPLIRHKASKGHGLALKNKDLAPTLLRVRSPNVNIGTVSAGLNRVVSVRTSRVTADGYYPLLFPNSP